MMVAFAPEFKDTEPYDEFARVAENASEMGVEWPAAHVARRDTVELASGQKLSAIRWGRTIPRSCSCTAVVRTRTRGTA